MTTFAAATLERLLTQQAVVERDVSTTDQWGADSTPDFQPYLTVACRMWWVKGSSSGRSLNDISVSPARDAPVSEGGMILPAGTDVTERDRITQVLNADGSVFTEGTIQILAVLDQGDHMEIDVLKVGLGE